MVLREDYADGVVGDFAAEDANAITTQVNTNTEDIATLLEDGVGLSDVVADSTPQLGGDLDLNGHKVGAATAADLTKLHGAGTLTGSNTGDQDLSGYATTSALTSGLAAKADLSGGKLLASQVPDIALVQFLGTVANQTEMLTLTGEIGDWCIRSDTSTVFILNGDSPATLGNWTQVAYPAAPVASVAGKTGAVTLVKGDVGLGSVDNTADADKNVATATKLATARKINGVDFDGTGDITIATGGGGDGTFDTNLYIEKDSPEFHLKASNADDQEWSIFVNGSGQLGIYDETNGAGPFRIYPETPVDTFVLESEGLRTSQPIRLAGSTSTPAKLAAIGDDIDIDINLAPKGAGKVRVAGVPVDLRGVTAIASNATPAVDVSVYRRLAITALAAAVTSMSSGLTGTGSLPDGAPFAVRFTDNGTARTITWGASFQNGPDILLTTTVPGKTHEVLVAWNSTLSKFVCLASDSIGY